MTRETDRPVGSPIETGSLSQGLREQARIQSGSTGQQAEAVENEYLNLNTGACATNPELCAGKPERVTGGVQRQAKKAADLSSRAMQRWSTAIRGYTAEDLSLEVGHFARRHPGLVVGGAVLTGFAVIRAMRTSGGGLKYGRKHGSVEDLSPGNDFLPGEEDVFSS